MARPRGEHINKVDRPKLKIQAWEMHARRISNEKIAIELGVCDDTVATFIKECYQEILLPNIAEAVKQDLQLLDQTIEIARGQYEKTKDPKDYEALDKMLIRRAKMIGYDAPDKLNVNVVEVTQADIELSELLNERKMRNASMEAELKAIASGESNAELSD